MDERVNRPEPGDLPSYSLETPTLARETTRFPDETPGEIPPIRRAPSAFPDETPPFPDDPKNKPRSHWLRWLLILLVVAAVAALGWRWWTSTHQAAAPGGQARAGRGAQGAQGAPQLVGAATVAKGDIRVILNELGTVTPLATVTVKTQISGQLIEVGFKEGQTVAKGDFLAQVDPRPYQVALQQAQGQLAHDQGLLDQAQSDLKRYQILGRQDSISQQQSDNQKFVVAQYQGTVLSDQAQVNSANLNLAYCHIVAPVAGQIGLRLVDPGNYVTPGDATGLLVITQMQPISALFSVPEDSLPDIIPRLRGGASLSVAAYDRANSKLLTNGQLATVDNQIDTTTGTVRLRALFDNPNEILYPNQFVNARLLVNTLKDTVRIPVKAVQRGEPGTFVYLIGADNTVTVRAVTLGPTDNDFVAVSSGLQPGDKVVTDGTDRLRDGAKVNVAPPPKAAPAANGQAAAPGTPPPAGNGQAAPAGGPPSAPASAAGADGQPKAAVSPANVDQPAAPPPGGQAGAPAKTQGGDAQAGDTQGDTQAGGRHRGQGGGHRHGQNADPNTPQSGGQPAAR